VFLINSRYLQLFEATLKKRDVFYNSRSYPEVTI